jgi:hypothetical protein
MRRGFARSVILYQRNGMNAIAYRFLGVISAGILYTIRNYYFQVLIMGGQGVQ